MIESFLTIGCIMFLGLLVYAYKMRQRIYNNKIPCSVILIPKNNMDRIYTKKINRLVKKKDLKKHQIRENSYKKNK